MCHIYIIEFFRYCFLLIFHKERPRDRKCPPFCGLCREVVVFDCSSSGLSFALSMRVGLVAAAAGALYFQSFFV